MKNKISFIDLPGVDIIFNLDRDNFYTELFNISSSMIFITKGEEITTMENEDIIKICKNSKLEEINEWNNNLNNKNLAHENYFLDNCLFVSNIFSESNEEEINIENIQNKFYHLLFNSNYSCNYKNINTEIFDAKSYQEYLEIWNLFFKIEDLFIKYQKDFLNQLNISSYYNPLKEKNFPKYCLKQIKIKINNCSIEIENKFDDDEDFYSKIKEIICSLMEEMNQKMKNSDEALIKEIANLLKQVHLNIKTIKFYHESFCEEFFSKLSQQILLSNQYLNSQYIKRFIETLQIFSYIENNILVNKQYKIQSKNNKEIQKINSFKNLIIKKNNIEKEFSNIKIKVHSSLENIKNNVDKLLKKFKEDNKKIINEYFQNTIMNDLGIVQENLNSLVKKLNRESKITNTKIDSIFPIYNLNIKNCSIQQFGDLVINSFKQLISPTKLLKPKTNDIPGWFYYIFQMSYKEELLNAISILKDLIDKIYEEKMKLFQSRFSIIYEKMDEKIKSIEMENKETNERLKSVNELIRKLTVISNQYINEDKFEI